MLSPYRESYDSADDKLRIFNCPDYLLFSFSRSGFSLRVICMERQHARYAVDLVKRGRVKGLDKVPRTSPETVHLATNIAMSLLQKGKL